MRGEAPKKGGEPNQKPKSLKGVRKLPETWGATYTYTSIFFFEFTATGRLHTYYIYVFVDFQLQGALYYIHIVFSGTETSGALEQKRIAFWGFPVHGRPETKTQT